MAYYKSLKLAGSKRVGNIFFASAPSKVRDALAIPGSVLDSALFMGNAESMLFMTPLWDEYVHPEFKEEK